jgi:hypothetical protein
MTKIFISYRRTDSQGWAGRLAEDLTRSFGDVAGFFDVESILPGDDFVDAIEKALAEAEAVIVLVGPQWLSASFPDGRRRLDEPNDFVAIEIATALVRHVRVIPVLLAGMAMPRAEQLPKPIASLARKQGLELSDTRWDYDCERLVAEIERSTSLRRLPTTPTQSGIAVRVAEGISLDDVKAGDVVGVKGHDAGVRCGPITIEVAKEAEIRNTTLGDVVGMITESTTKK